MTGFHRYQTPADILWLTPDHTGIRAALVPIDGTELVGVLFNDAAAGPIGFAMTQDAATVVIDAIQGVIDNTAYLRVENNKIRNEKENTN